MRIIVRLWLRIRPGILGLAAGAILAGLWPGVGAAVLGGRADSVNSDRAFLSGSLSQSTRTSYTVDTITTPSGTMVNEYVAPDGTVFAVSWRGPRPPDLSQLLGSYFAGFQSAARAQPQRRAMLRVRTDSAVVESFGHMRDLRGRAYVPALVPAGVTVDEIQ